MCISWVKDILTSFNSVYSYFPPQESFFHLVNNFFPIVIDYLFLSPRGQPVELAQYRTLVLQKVHADKHAFFQLHNNFACACIREVQATTFCERNEDMPLYEEPFDSHCHAQLFTLRPCGFALFSLFAALPSFCWRGFAEASPPLC